MALSVTFNDLVIAYRKAKADMFYETGHLTSLAFANYEQGLTENLNSLLTKLTSSKPFRASNDFVGGCAYIVKNVTIEKQNSTGDQVQVYYSSSDRAWEDSRLSEIKFRIIGQHSVDLYILSSLWIIKVGAKLEEKVSNKSYGCRLKRKFQKPGLFVDREDQTKNEIDDLELGHFRPYIVDYKKWQSDGTEKIEGALKADRKIIAITADIRRFYHRIDPSFILSKEFQDFIGVTLSKDEETVTRILVNAISLWSEHIYNQDDLPEYLRCNGHCGVPVGLSSSKVIANLLLTFLDEVIERQLDPIYYGRYVDDIFLVISDNGNVTDSRTFWRFLSQSIKEIRVEENSNENNAIIEIPYARNCRIEFGSGKEKLFFLEGSSGESFIKTLKEALEENSSEWRMLPQSETNLDSLAQKMAKASSDYEEAVNGLRKSEGVSIQRLNFALKLRNFESVVDLLPKEVWEAGLKKFFVLVENFVLPPDKIAVYSKYHPRLLRLAIRAREPDLATRIWDRISKSWDQLNYKIEKEWTTNDNLGQASNARNLALVNKARDYHFELLNEAVYSSIDLDRNSYGK